MPKLTISEEAGAPSPSSQIKAWSGLAAAAVIAATSSDFLIRMATDLKRDTSKGPLEVRIYDNAGSVFYDLIELQDETEEAIRVHMIAAALRAGAPIGDGEEFKDIAKDKKKVVKVYQELQVYFSGFNQQMYSATIEAEPTAFQEANVNYAIVFCLFSLLSFPVSAKCPLGLSDECLLSAIFLSPLHFLHVFRTSVSDCLGDA